MKPPREHGSKAQKHDPGGGQALEAAIREQAKALGFDALGIARADALSSHRALLEEWLREGRHGRMGYMANHFEKRLDPRVLMPGARSVLVLALNYFPALTQPPGCSYRVARYAYGKDYHHVLRDRLHLLARALEDIAGSHTCRVFTDSGPVLEKAWAERAGLGSVGKNTCLIIPRKGSHYFLGEIITTLELKPDEPFRKDLCGSCRRCMDACPTRAITAPGRLDARRCLSYLTIELKDKIPAEFRKKTGGWIFGCDICQEVCPHNRHATASSDDALRALPAVSGWSDADWEGLDERRFREWIQQSDSPMARITFEKLKDNISCCNASCCR